MKTKQIVTSTLKSFVDIKGWMGYDQLKENSGNVFRAVSSTFRIEKPAYKETFEEAVARMGLTEEDLKKREQRFLYLMRVYLIVDAFILLYLFYLLWERHFLPGFIAFLITTVLFFVACSMHFYSFQIKHRKLGCSIREWLDGEIKENNNV